MKPINFIITLYNKHPVFFVFIALAPVLGFPIFYHLGIHPIYNWDESRLAINMLEMLEKGNPFVTYFNGEPDHYNTKPPLLIWLQSLGFLLSGNLELSMRIPSALAAIGSCFALIWFCSKVLKKPLVGGFAALVLVSISGYIELHGTRTGDYDSLITLWLILALMQFFLFTISDKKNHIFYFYTFFALGILTKASVPFLMIPALIIWAIISKSLLKFLKNKHFYIGMLLPIFALAISYPLRELYDPGFIKAAWYNDFGGRLTTALDGHSHEFTYYLEKMWFERAKYFIWIFPLSLLLTLFSKDKKVKNIGIFSFLFITTYLLIISKSVTKLYWYDMPVFPFLSLVIAISISVIWEFIAHIKYSKTGLAIFCLLLILVPFLQNAKKSIEAPNFSWEGTEYYEPSILIKEAIQGKKDLQDYILLFDNDYYPHYQAYNKILQTRMGYGISYKQYLSQLEPADKVIYFQPHRFKDSLESCFIVQTMDSSSPYLKLIKIKKIICQKEQQTFQDIPR